MTFEYKHHEFPITLRGNYINKKINNDNVGTIIMTSLRKASNVPGLKIEKVNF